MDLNRGECEKAVDFALAVARVRLSLGQLREAVDLFEKAGLTLAQNENVWSLQQKGSCANCGSNCPDSAQCCVLRCPATAQSKGCKGASLVNPYQKSRLQQKLNRIYICIVDCYMQLPESETQAQ